MSPRLRNALAVVALTAASVALPAGARGQAPYTEYTEHTIHADGAGAHPALALSSVAWLAGRWQGDGLGAVAEESWLPAVGGAMVGTFRLVDDGAVRFYELVTLVEDGGSLVMRLKHFAPDLVGWEAKEERVEFPLLRADAETLWFDGLTMHRVSADEMHVWVALEQRGKGVEEALFSYRRVPPETR